MEEPFFAVFDGPDRNMTTPVRSSATTTLQALFMLNDSLVHDSADQFTDRLIGDDSNNAARIANAYRQALGRPARDSEIDQCVRFLSTVQSELSEGAEEAEKSAFRSLIRALLRLNEFSYVD